MTERYENPCKECQYRTYDCHTTCFKYKEWQANEDGYKQFLREKAHPYRQYAQYRYKQDSQLKHKRNRRRRS